MAMIIIVPFKKHKIVVKIKLKSAYFIAFVTTFTQQYLPKLTFFHLIMKFHVLLMI